MICQAFHNKKDQTDLAITERHEYLAIEWPQMEKYAHKRNVILGIIKAHYNIVKARPSDVNYGGCEEYILFNKIKEPIDLYPTWGILWHRFKVILSDSQLCIYEEFAFISINMSHTGFSTEHTLGHIFAITTSVNNGTFNEDICISSGFMLAEFICGQGMIVTITAISGMSVRLLR